MTKKMMKMNSEKLAFARCCELHVCRQWTS